jgi:hypothetical protein
MNENLLGYLLNALDLDEHREVEGYLREHPEASQRLGVLRRALEPLAADAEPPRPPADLVVRTLSFVAEHGAHDRPAAAAVPTLPFEPPARRGWRRPDVLVAAGLLLAISMLLVPAVQKARYHYQVSSCQHNLHLIHDALAQYSDHNEGAFPRVDGDNPRRNFAGVFAPALVEQGVFPSGVVLHCPASDQPPAPVLSLHEIDALPREQFEQVARTLGGCYAYSLGYRDGFDQLQGLYRGFPQPVPILADAPPQAGRGNSLNHAGTGQNVLFTDGNVRFVNARDLPGDDDIYLNRARRVAAGLDARDTVLGASGAPAREGW